MNRNRSRWAPWRSGRVGADPLDANMPDAPTLDTSPAPAPTLKPLPRRPTNPLPAPEETPQGTDTLRPGIGHVLAFGLGLALAQAMRRSA